MKKLIVLTTFFSIIATVNSNAQRTESQKTKFQATYNATKSLVASKDYQFFGEFVHNNKKREKLQSNSPALVIDGYDVVVKMRSLSTDKKSLDFESTIDNYSKNFNADRQEVKIEFVTKSKTETFNFYIRIVANGNAFLTMHSNKGYYISYTGKLK